MYKNRKYRSGTSANVRASVSNASKTATTTTNNDSSAISSIADATAASRILTDRANVIPEENEDVGPTPKLKVSFLMFCLFEFPIPCTNALSPIHRDQIKTAYKDHDVQYHQQQFHQAKLYPLVVTYHSVVFCNEHKHI